MFMWSKQFSISGKCENITSSKGLSGIAGISQMEIIVIYSVECQVGQRMCCTLYNDVKYYMQTDEWRKFIANN